MGGFTNGRFPLSMMVKLGHEHYLPAGTAARWRWMVRMALQKYGVLLYITGGWNGYRPYDIQVQYRKDLGIWAALPGYSSHGLIYQGRQCAAIDVANWSQLGWGRFKALCRLAGFTVDFVTPQELWHIGDFNDIWTAPAWATGGNATPIPIGEEEDEDMAKYTIRRTKNTGSNAAKYPIRFALSEASSGYWEEQTDSHAGNMNALAKAYETPDAIEQSESAFNGARAAHAAVRARKG